MNQTVNPLRTRSATLAFLLFACFMGAVAIVFLTKYDSQQPSDSSHLSSMMVQAERHGTNYCADFVADKHEHDQVKITITNCGDDVIALKVNRRPKGGVLDIDEEYETVLDSDAKFSVSVETLDGEPVGSFAY